MSSSRPDPSRNSVPGSHADPDDGEEGFDLLARGGHGTGQRAAVRPELLDLLPEQQLDAVLAVEIRDLARELLRGECGNEVVVPRDERDLQPEHAQRGSDLGADEAAADDEDLARLGRLLRERDGIGEGAEGVHGRADRRRGR